MQGAREKADCKKRRKTAPGFERGGEVQIAREADCQKRKKTAPGFERVAEVGAKEDWAKGSEAELVGLKALKRSEKDQVEVKVFGLLKIGRAHV